MNGGPFDVMSEYLEGAFCALMAELIIDNYTRVGECLRTERAVLAVVGMVGKYKGRIIISASPETVEVLTRSMNFGDPVSDPIERCKYFAEFANMYGGKVTTLINNTFRGSEVRLTPPAIFAGKHLEVVTPRMQSASICFRGEQGDISIDVGLEGAKV